MAQTTLVPSDRFYQSSLDRYRILNGYNIEGYHSNFQPINRKMAVVLIDSLDSALLQRQTDKILIEYLRNDNWNLTESENESQRPILKHFYKNKTDFYHIDQKEFMIRVNPVMHFSVGKELNSDLPLFINTRAIEVRGSIDNKVGFYSYLSENQVRFPQYVNDYRQQFGVLPGEGFHKGFKENGYDFFNVRGYIDFSATKHINIQFGHDRFRIGQGIRSVLLSDNVPPYLFMKIQTNIWKFNYTNLFTQFVQENKLVPAGLNGQGKYPEKHMSLHHLSLNLGKKFNLGFFETIMYGANDGGTGTLEAKYLNPIIFYRAVEHQNGSADNVQVGMDAEWLITKGVSLYGQFLLDEFLLEYLKDQSGWWGNKYGALVGLKYFNLLNINQLDLTIEGSLVRPYAYSHYTLYGSYSHFQQPLAHIRGSNFREAIVDLKYQPFSRFFIKSRLILGEYGSDETTLTNWGGNILKSYVTREQEFDNKIGQGVNNKSTFFTLGTSYMLKQNLFFDARYIYRNVNSEDPTLTTKTSIFSASIRLNIAEREQEF